MPDTSQIDRPDVTDSHVTDSEGTSPARARRAPRLGISPAQVVAGATAAVVATAIAASFGLTGTAIGAGLASVIATVVSATSHHSLRRWPRTAAVALVALAVAVVGLTGVQHVFHGHPPAALDLAHPVHAALDRLSSLGTDVARDTAHDLARSVAQFAAQRGGTPGH
ncbi:hypothetical protein [Nocardioides terrisoli]|uniref:hypothetical protein n=1 Tax=Nocardioides terrisoli TaxID=3388267 RepID=UPI00287BA34D|nr:hypothetical protein [Nocardioides marmorisolisilvae]